MNYRFIISISLLFLLGSCKQSDPIEKEYKLVWSDEFDDKALNEDNWDIQLGDGRDYGLWQWGNNEEQWYTKENLSVSGGKLLIKTVKEASNGYDYTSARIRSLNKFDFRYGRIEASIRMSDVAGLWYAFWMLPSNPKDPWPISGEIDIMEFVGRNPNEILNTLHLADSRGNQIIIGDSYPVETIINEFHQYAVEWDENKITWFIDSVETFKVLNSDTRVTGTWSFDSQFHLLLNTAVGGNLGGDVNQSRLVKPKYMEVDYVRVYQTNTK